MHTRVAIVHSVAIVLLATMAACTGGSPGSPSVPASSRATPGPPSARASTPTVTPMPALGSATARLPDGPPIAMLGGLAGDPVAGDLGTVSWGGTTSDAPWVVGPATGHAAAGTSLLVTFDPSIQPRSWQARWAPVDGRAAGAPGDGGSGTGEPVLVTAPDTAGDWSLQVEARFDADSSGAWYWRIQVDR